MMPRPALDLRRVFDKQRAAFAQDRYPSLQVRIERLHRLRELLLDGQGELQDAVCRDFGHRSLEESRVAEVAATIATIDYTLAHLGRWMRPARRGTSIWFLPAHNQERAQPLGVVGIMAPWNYPVNLAMVPLVSALAAGNRAMVKMSELSDATTRVLARLVQERFGEDEVVVVGGDAQVAESFSALPFAHLLFTGSGRVGRMVMSAAARNLTPVTLELGGKCPAIVGDDYPISEAAQRILWGKTFNAAQTCVAPDYVLVPRGEAHAFVEAAMEHYAKRFPKGALEDAYTAIIDQRNFDRLSAMVGEARDAGARIFAAERPTPALAAARKFPLTMVLDAPANCRLLQEEIFGPVLPVLEYDGLDDALRHVNQGDHPLGLYYFGKSSAGRQQVIDGSMSGGVAVNDVMLQFLQVDLSFGGVGASGFGRYHGRAGFDTFSHLKSVFVQRGVGHFTGLKLLYPPYGHLGRMVIRLMGG